MPVPKNESRILKGRGRNYKVDTKLLNLVLFFVTRYL